MKIKFVLLALCLSLTGCAAGTCGSSSSSSYSSCSCNTCSSQTETVSNPGYSCTCADASCRANNPCLSAGRCCSAFGNTAGYAPYNGD